MIKIRCGILTISDRSFKGTRSDTSGPALHEAINSLGWQVAQVEIVPDDMIKIQEVLQKWSDSEDLDLIVTTGGTGFAPRDITPEATSAILDRLAPGLSEAMRNESLRKTPHAMLSRGIAGMRKHTLIVNLPGSPKAAVENFQTIQAVIPHAVELLRENPSSEQSHHYSPAS